MRTLLLCCLLAIGLMACQSEEKPAQTQDTTPDAPTESTQTESAPAEPAEGADSTDEPSTQETDEAATEPRPQSATQKPTQGPDRPKASAPSAANPAPAESISPAGEDRPDPLEAKYASQLPETFSVLALCRDKFFAKLPTIGAGLHDAEVSVSTMQPWTGKLTDMAGTYRAGLDAEVSQVNFQVQSGRLIGTLAYTQESVSAEGLISNTNGKATMAYSKLAGSILAWPPLNNLREQMGQFVVWNDNGTTRYGFLLYNPTKRDPFTLLTRS